MPSMISIRLPDTISEKLENLCKELDRTKTYIVKKAIEEYIDEYSDYQIALERLLDKEEKILSSKEVREKLGIYD